MAESISKPRLIVVEGRDESVVFDYYQRYLNLEDIQLIEARGKDNIGNQLAAIKATTGFENVTHLAVVRDADADPDGALSSVQSSLRKAGLPVPSGVLDPVRQDGLTVVVLILPDSQRPGCLESLCLASAGSDTPCLNEFMDCCQTAGLDLHTDLEKRRISVYLASQKRFTNTIGGAARAGIWDFSSPAFDPLRKLYLHLQ